MIPCPHTVLLNTPGGVSLTRQCVPGSGKGQHMQTLYEQTPRMQEPERVSNQSQGLRDTGPMHTLAFTDAVELDIRCARYRLIPLGVQ